MDDASFARATARAAERSGPHAVAVRYLPARARLVLVLSTGAEWSMPVADIEGLSGAAAEDLREIAVSPAGTGLHFPRLDADLSVPALIEGITGSRRWMAQRLGQAGGSARTARKALAARENGKRGGRLPTRVTDTAE